MLPEARPGQCGKGPGRKGLPGTLLSSAVS